MSLTCRNTTLWLLLYLIDQAMSVVIGNDNERPIEALEDKDLTAPNSDQPEPNPHGQQQPGSSDDDADAVQHYALIIFATVCSAAVIAAVTIIVVCYCKRRSKEKQLQKQ